MNEKHNLDRLFQEKFKDFEVAPPEFVWENIREELQDNKKKKSKVVPLWIRVSGVAALLVLGGFIATLFFNDAENPANNAPAVVIDNNNTTTPSDVLNTTPGTNAAQSAPSEAAASSDNTTTNNNTAVASGENNTGTAADKNILPNNRNNINTTAAPAAVRNNNNAVAYEGNKTSKSKNRNTNRNSNSAITSGDAVAGVTSQRSGTNTNANGSGNTTAAKAAQNPAQNNGISTTYGIAATDTQSSSRNTGNNNAAANQGNNSQNTTSATGNTTAEKGLAANDASAGSNSGNNQNDPASKNNIIDKDIPLTEGVVLTPADTTKAAPENELEKLLQEKLKKEEEDKALAENAKGKDRWNVRPQVAPVFYNSIGNGSPINEQFAANSKSYDNDLSYGLGINYAVSDRITIRSGVNTVNLNYSTNDIAYYVSLNNATSNISQAKAGNIVIQNPGDATPETFLINGQSTQLMEGSMLQKTGYIEVPLEMSYALVNNKFGIDLIGGMSTLFLNENNVSVVSSTGMSSQVGKAQNLNNLHFSTNVGVGFRYKFFDAFQASFEPTFKYQVNAYSRDAGNFKPYFIGLYSGISFSF